MYMLRGVSVTINMADVKCLMVQGIHGLNTNEVMKLGLLAAALAELFMVASV